MKQLLSSTLLLSTAAVLFVSCSKNKTEGNVGFQLKTTNRSAQVSGRLASANINWNSGYVYADKIEFEAEKDDDFEISYESKVNRRIDLFSSVPQQLGNIQIPAGKYDEISVEIDFANSPADTAFVLRGSYSTSSSEVIPVLFFINELLELEAEADDVLINNDNDFRSLTTFDLSQLTTGITATMLNNATRTNGVIVISKNNNSNLYNIIRSNINNMDNVEIDD